MKKPNNVCATCSSPKLPNSDYCEGCQAKIDSYEPDEKDSIE